MCECCSLLQSRKLSKDFATAPFASNSHAGQWHTAIMASHNRNTFDFFGLPRELRDTIYEYLLVTDKPLRLRELDYNYPMVDPKPTISHAPGRKCLTLNAQFKTEYEQELHLMASLTFHDNGTALDYPVISGSLKHLQNVKLELQINPRVHSSVGREITVHIAWATELKAQLLNVKHLSGDYLLVLEWDIEGGDVFWSLAVRSGDLVRLQEFVTKVAPSQLRLLTCCKGLDRWEDPWQAPQRLGRT